jgi:hypothetical protein
MTDIDAEIARRTAEAMRTHALKQAHAELGKVRSALRSIEFILEPPGTTTHLPAGDEHADAIEAMVVNSLEQIMWSIERDIIKRQAAQ